MVAHGSAAAELGRVSKAQIIILVRHGKSDWDSPALADHERALKRRGRDDALRLGEWLREQDLVPGLILCSPARRTRETLDALMMAWPQPVASIEDPKLYLAPRGQLLECLMAHRELNGPSAPPILILAHNPGLEDLLAHWSRLPVEEAQMPTAACAVFAAEPGVDWQAAGALRLVQLRRPRE